MAGLVALVQLGTRNAVALTKTVDLVPLRISVPDKSPMHSLTASSNLSWCLKSRVCGNFGEAS